MKNKTTYVDGFVLVIPKKKTGAYKKIAEEAAAVWTQCGALRYRECLLDDAKPEHIVLTFPKLAQVKPSEAVWFSYIEFKSKKHRDSVNKKVMAYFNKKYTDAEMHTSMPFDMNRVSYGGFTVEVSA